MGIWFTSDTHFGHRNVIKHCRRPFKDVEEMNEAMVTNFRECLTEDDLLIHLGDVAFGKNNLDLIDDIPGSKMLVRGNHDKSFTNKFLQDYFQEIQPDPMELDVDALGDKGLWLCHYPVQQHDERYTLCGHIHEKWKVQWNMLNVGVDVWNFKPVSLDDVLECIKLQETGKWDENVFPRE